MHLMHPVAGVHKVHSRSGGPLDASVASSRFHVAAQSRCPDDGQVGDLKNSAMSPSDIFHRFIAEKRRSSTSCVDGI